MSRPPKVRRSTATHPTAYPRRRGRTSRPDRHAPARGPHRRLRIAGRTSQPARPIAIGRSTPGGRRPAREVVAQVCLSKVGRPSDGGTRGSIWPDQRGREPAKVRQPRGRSAAGRLCRPLSAVIRPPAPSQAVHDPAQPVVGADVRSANQRCPWVVAIRSRLRQSGRAPTTGLHHAGLEHHAGVGHLDPDSVSNALTAAGLRRSVPSRPGTRSKYRLVRWARARHFVGDGLPDGAGRLLDQTSMRGGRAVAVVGRRLGGPPPRSSGRRADHRRPGRRPVPMTGRSRALPVPQAMRRSSVSSPGAVDRVGSEVTVRPDQFCAFARCRSELEGSRGWGGT